MEYEEFIGRVQERAELDSPEEAAAAVKATLGTLGEMLSPKERHDLAAELARPLKDWLTLWMERPPRELTNPHRFNLEEFYNRVAARSESDIRRHQAQPGGDPGPQEAVSRRLRDVAAADEYDELLSGQRGGVAIDCQAAMTGERA
jgi:uncharacterized protein (DUF2267 family)